MKACTLSRLCRGWLFGLGWLLWLTSALASYEEGLAELNNKNYDAARALLTQASEKNDTRALILLSSMYFRGTGVEKNEKLGMQYLEKSAQLGDAQAMILLAELYILGTQNMPRDSLKGRAWALKAYEKKDTRAGYLFALSVFKQEMSYTNEKGGIDQAKYEALSKRSLQERALDAQAYAMLGQSVSSNHPHAIVVSMVVLGEQIGEHNGQKILDLFQTKQTPLSNVLSDPIGAAPKSLNDHYLHMKQLGVTYTTPKIYRNALLQALPFTMAQMIDSAPTCQPSSFKMLKMEVTQPIQDKVYLPVESEYFKDAILVSGNWKERWTFELCGKAVSYPITFLADGMGGAYFEIKNSERK